MARFAKRSRKRRCAGGMAKPNTAPAVRNTASFGRIAEVTCRFTPELSSIGSCEGRWCACRCSAGTAELAPTRSPTCGGRRHALPPAADAYTGDARSDPNTHEVVHELAPAPAKSARWCSVSKSAAGAISVTCSGHVPSKWTPVHHHESRSDGMSTRWLRSRTIVLAAHELAFARSSRASSWHRPSVDETSAARGRSPTGTLAAAAPTSARSARPRSCLNGAAPSVRAVITARPARAGPGRGTVGAPPRSGGPSDVKLAPPQPEHWGSS